MKNSFKVGAVALVIAVSFAACKGNGSSSTDTTKTDSVVKKDSVVKVDSTVKKDTSKMAVDTTKKETLLKRNNLLSFPVNFLQKVTCNFFLKIMGYLLLFWVLRANLFNHFKKLTMKNSL